MPLFGKKLSDKVPKPDKPTIHLEGKERMWIAGAMGYFREVVDHVVKVTPEENRRIPFMVTLMPEAKDPHDYKAIAVYFEGQKIGWVPQDHAAQYRPAIARLANRATVTARAAINCDLEHSALSVDLYLPSP